MSWNRKTARVLLAYDHVLAIDKISFNQFFGNTVSSICNEAPTTVANWLTLLALATHTTKSSLGALSPCPHEETTVANKVTEMCLFEMCSSFLLSLLQSQSPVFFSLTSPKHSSLKTETKEQSTVQLRTKIQEMFSEDSRFKPQYVQQDVN